MPIADPVARRAYQREWCRRRRARYLDGRSCEAYSLAWVRYGLPRPVRHGWASSFTDRGYSTEVDQATYHHPARKRTWLYYVGPKPPWIDWRITIGVGVIGAGIHSGECVGRDRVDGYAARATPLAFRDVLLKMARSAAKGAA